MYALLITLLLNLSVITNAAEFYDLSQEQIEDYTVITEDLQL